MPEAPQTETSETPLPPGAAATADTETNQAENENNGRGFQFWIIVSVGGSIAACLLLFAVAMAAGTISGRWENVAALVSVIRDLMLIFLILQAILVGVALIAMIVQLSALVNLLQNEIQPIIDNTQQATKAVSGTAQFISKRVTAPVVRSFAVLAGARAFFKEIGGIRKATRSNGPQNGATATPDSNANEVNAVEAKHEPGTQG